MSYQRLAGQGRPDVGGSPAECELEAGSDAPGRAREFVATLLGPLPEELRGRARQVVTELVTNAVKHSGSSRITVRAWTNGRDAFAVEVTDGGPGFDVQPRVAGHADPEGWGLMFVDMLSEAWGAGGPGSPSVWAHFEPRSMNDDPQPPADPTLDDRVRDLLDVRMLLDSVKDYAIFAIDSSGRVTLWNPGAERLTGYSTAEILGSSLATISPEAEVEADLGAALSHGRHELERWMRRKDGSRFWADCVITPIFDATGSLRGFSCVMRDVTWRKRLDEDREGLIERIKELARTDELTGLPNRRRWHEELDRELARARRHGRMMCVAMVDLDGFKAYNDKHGHTAGDTLLRETSVAWGGALRSTDMLARYGGDEFSAILPDCDIDEALIVIERLRVATPRRMTCSAGIASSDGSEPAEGLVRRADVALYDAKRSGRNATATVRA